MAPSFFNDIRRRSRASFRNSKSSESITHENTDPNATNGGNSANVTKSTNGTNITNSINGIVSKNGSAKSSLNSLYGGGTTPPTPGALTTSNSASNLSSLGNNMPPPTRPTVMTSSSNRYSVSGMSGLGSPAQKSSSPYAPRVLSIESNTLVYQKAISIYGVIADPATQALEGEVTVSRPDEAFPPTYWPVSDSHWKSLVYLMPGPNRLRFDFTSPKLPNSNTSNPIHSSYLNITYIPPMAAPPLQMVILLGSDSPGTYDAVPGRIEKEGNGIETAIKKYRMAGYLWQAFTAEQMHRNKLGRRTFRFDEEWVTGTSNYRDIQTGSMRSEAKIHVLRCSKTVAELRDIQLAQQNKDATRAGELHSIAMQTMREHFRPLPGQKLYISCLYLDAHWNKDANLITGHAALGSDGGDIALAIFGSQALQSYPSCFEEVDAAFTDCTPTDTKFVANDCNESGSSWEAANIGLGAHLHEVGHALGLPHQNSGIMLRDYTTFNRSFTTREPYSTRTKSKGGLVLKDDECTWHRLDCLRFRSHPCFQVPGDPQRPSEDSVQAFPVDNGNLIVTATSGVAYVEINREDPGAECQYWWEFGDGNGNGPIQKQLTLTEQDLRARLPEGKRNEKLALSIKSFGGGSHEIKDFNLLVSKSSKVKLSNGQLAFRSSKLGASQMEGSTPEEVVFGSAVQQTKLMTKVKVYHGMALDGIEFLYEDSTSQMFGKRGGKEGGDTFNLDTRRGEIVTGFYVRAGLWIDGISILTNLGRKSQVYGNATGGSGHTFQAPRGYCVAGITGSCAQWVDGFGLLITR